MIKFFFAVLAVLVSLPLWASERSCKDIFFLSEHRQSLVNVVIEGFSHHKIHKVIAGDKPEWNDYKWIVDTKDAIRKANITADELAVLKSKISQASLHFESRDHKPKIADLNYRFYEQLQIINQMLRAELFPNVHLRYAEKDQALINKATQLVKANEEKLRKYYHTSSYRNTQDLVRYIEKYKSSGQKLIELVNDGLIVTIRRPENARFWVPLTGFQNQRVTGNSKGHYEPGRRNRIESLLIGVPNEEYESYSVRLSPQYGEARPDLDRTDFKFHTNASSYGSDLWVVKKEVVETRTTWTPTDSFGHARPESGFKSWNQMFLPWSHREFMVPYLLVNYDSSGIFYPTIIPPNFKLDFAGYSSSYVETQIWGPVTIRDIEAFIFTKTVPSAEFVRELKSNGIKIIDGRDKSFRPYEVAE